jgi:predicted amidohydrolase YtcJ
MSRYIQYILAGILLLTGAACSKQEDTANQAGAPATATEQAADYVFTGGKVYTVNEKQPWAGAVAVKGNKIVYVGDAAGAKEFVGKDTKTIDTTGKVVMPGFVDAHDHLIGSGWTSKGVHLFDGKNKEDYIAIVKKYADEHPDLKRIVGIGWSTGTYGGRPTAKDLDKAVPDRPALILDFTAHDAWLNTKAMEIAGVTKDSPDDQKDVIYWVRDKDGTPTGTGVEGQWMEAYVAIGAWDPDKIINETIDKLHGIAASNGVTTYLNPGIVTPNMKDTNGKMQDDMKAAMENLSKRENAGTLKLRTFVLPFFKRPNADIEQVMAFMEEMRKKYNGEKLFVRQVKIHPEANWNVELAPMLEPYQSGKKGVFGIPPDKIKEIMVAAAKHGFDSVIHTDSTGTSRAGIDGILAAREVDPNNRSALHHATWLTPEDQKRVIDNKIPINSTPNFTNDWSGTDKDALTYLGEKRTMANFGKYPDFARAGVKVSLGPDLPSTPPTMQAPLFVIQGAVTMKDPANPKAKAFPPNVKPMSIEQAVRAMTIDAAWQLHLEDKIGSLEVGKLADVVVLDGNPFEADKMKIQDIKVSQTMMDGNFTFDRAKEMAKKEVVKVKVTNPDLQSAIDVKALNLLVQSEINRGGSPICGERDKNDAPSDVNVFAPDEVNKAFAGLPGKGYNFARPARAIYWKQDDKNCWIQWTVKDKVAVLWAYDPEAKKAVEILQVSDK